MINYVWLVIGLAGVGLLAYRAGRIWIDAGKRGFRPARRLGWALWGAIIPARYWWGARVDACSPDERAELMVRETAALGLTRADSLCCPLCEAEVPKAWTLTAGGQPAVASGPVECPRCDFRLDACRHCVHFLPGSPKGWARSAWDHGDMTWGRCGHYKRSQPVEQACAPDMARQLKARGYDQIRAPAPIVDSYLPLDSCRAFQPEHKRLRANKIGWPGARRVALLRILSPPPSLEASPGPQTTEGDEQWLL